MQIDYNKPRTDGYVGVGFFKPEEDYNYDSSAKKFYDQGIDDNAAVNRRTQDSSDSFNKPYKPDSLNREYSQTPYFIAKWLACSIIALLLITIYSAPYKTIVLSIIIGLVITVIMKGIGYFIERKVVNRL